MRQWQSLFPVRVFVPSRLSQSIYNAFGFHSSAYTKLTTPRERCVRNTEVRSSIILISTIKKSVTIKGCWLFFLCRHGIKMIIFSCVANYNAQSTNTKFQAYLCTTLYSTCYNYNKEGVELWRLVASYDKCDKNLIYPKPHLRIRCMLVFPLLTAGKMVMRYQILWRWLPYSNYAKKVNCHVS